MDVKTRNKQMRDPEINNGSLATADLAAITDLFPTEAGDTSGSGHQLPHFHTEVAACYEKAPVYDRRGTIQEYLYEMSDGTTYPAITGVPNRRTAQSDTAVVFTNAWLTSTKGHNRHTLLRMMDTGYPVIMIGTEDEEKNPGRSIEQRLKGAASTDLFKISHDLNRILDAVLPGIDIRQEEIITLGESRGAMKAAAFNVEQYSRQRRAVYADLTAPCFARAPRLTEVPEGLFQIAKEATAFGRIGLQLALQPRGRHYMGTVRRDPEYYVREFCKLPSLLSGQAGKLACATRQDTPIHLRLFKSDKWSQHDEWSRIYGGRPMVHLEKTRGTHIDIAGSETLDNIELRLRALSESRGYSGDFEAVDFKPIIALHRYGRPHLVAAEAPMDLAA